MQIWLTQLLLLSYVGAAKEPEYRVKAFLIHSLTRFVEWPTMAFARPDSPFILGIAGKDPFGDYLSAIEGKMVHGHPLAVKRLAPGPALRECHALFVGTRDKKELARFLELVAGAQVLTLGETEQFCEQGGMIRFVIHADETVGFEINQGKVEQAKLNISAQLLRLADKVLGKPTH